jgi:Mrp family chromosome partitioning ATPase
MAVASRPGSQRERRRAQRRILSAEQLARETGLPLLIEAPVNAFSSPGGVVGSRSSVTRAQLETARALAEKLGSLTDGGRGGSVFLADGIESRDGVSPALALATVSALDGRRTLLVDVDFAERPLASRLALGDGPGIGDYLNRAARPQDLLQPLQLGGRAAENGVKPGSLVFIAAGDGGSDPMPSATLDRFRDFITKVTKAYDFVVLAGEPLLAPSEPGQLISLVDEAVVCVRPAEVSKEGALRARAALHQWLPRTVGLVAASG